ncbi:MAG: zinc-ribbon domain-containing protein, partial [Deltaproteobacteria bacterium]|nr:zinc-ribbon domain-containing protein [Deltaproteobacteria bacterium]
MIKVSCPSCNAAYDVDERRLPASGLRMRCPKCEESFQVHPDGSRAKSGGGASPASMKPARRKPTQVGLGPNVAPPSPASPPAVPQKPAPAEDVDLPAPFQRSRFDDLPAPKLGSRSLDLDPFADPDHADLPTPKAKSDPPSSAFDPFADLDLPAPMRAPGGTDLPAPMTRQGSSDVDLPAPMRARQARAMDPPRDEVDLPMAMSDAELPKPMPASRVPDPISLDSELPVAWGEEDLPVARDDFASLELDGPSRVHSGGPIELDLPDGDDLDLDLDVDLDLDRPHQQPAQPPPLGRGLGSPAASSVDALEGSGHIGRDSTELDLPTSDELEFSEFSGAGEEVQRMPHPGGARPEVSLAPDKPKRKLALKRPAWLMKLVAVLGVFVIILGAGFYSGTTKYGLFGIHLVEPFLPASGDEVLVTQAIESAELVAAVDTYAATRSALSQLAAGRRDAALNRSLVARSLLHESYYQVRFGQDAESASVADDLRLRLKRRGDEAPRVHVALAADALRNADTALASSEIARAAEEDPTDTYVDLVAGELALRMREGQTAVDAFSRAMKKHDSPRAQWGLSRALRILEQNDASVAAAKATLKASPDHAGARVAVAAQHIADGRIEEAAALLRAPAGLEPVNGATLQVSRSDKSAALTLLAGIEEQRGRVGAAREMYEKAIELDTGNVQA